MRLADRHTRKFRVPAEAELVEQYAAWRGWDAPWWVDDEEMTDD